MKIKRGIPVSPGVVVREAFVLDTEEFLSIPRRTIDAAEVEQEIERFEAAIQQAVAGVRESQAQAAEKRAV